MTIKTDITLIWEHTTPFIEQQRSTFTQEDGMG
jgi:hypothetical protein